MPSRRRSALPAFCLSMLIGVAPAITPALAQNEQADKAKQQAAEQAKKEAQRLNDLGYKSKAIHRDILKDEERYKG